MGIPDQDKLGYLCRQDVNTIEQSVTAIRTALKNVTSLLGANTWTGSAADKWATDFNGRMGAISRLFDSYPPEECRLIDAAQKKQAEMDRART